jgi:hypothetical protein
MRRTVVVLLAAAAAGPASAAAAPVVVVQAGHERPGEPGYIAQTGAGSGPFGSEVAFTGRLADAVTARLRASGVTVVRVGARPPLGVSGASFISLHHDAVGGTAQIGHAITGAGENWYRGEGFGTPSPVPYPDSAPHRRATTVSPSVEAASRRLAQRLEARFRPVYTRANGARAGYTGIQPRNGNVRMMRFYGYYRTTAQARVLLEAGAGGADDVFLAKTDLISRAVTRALLDDLRARSLL